jgi:hypothetical protein
MIFTLFDTKSNSLQTWLIHFLSRDNFLLIKNQINSNLLPSCLSLHFSNCDPSCIIYYSNGLFIFFNNLDRYTDLKYSVDYV